MIFALSFLWVYFCLKSVIWAVALGLILALCSSYIIFRIQNKTGQITASKKQNKKAVASFYDYLKYNENNAALFTELYRYYGYAVDAVDYDSFVATKDCVSTYVMTLYGKDNVTANDVTECVRLAKRRKTDKLRLYACKIDSVALQNAQRRFDVAFVDVSNAYELFAQAGKLPIVPDVKPAKNSFVAKYAFCRKRFGWYFASSVFTALLSLIAYFPYYLLGWSTVMLGLALYSMFNTRYNVKQTQIRLN